MTRETLKLLSYCKSSINPGRGRGGVVFVSNTFEAGGLFNLEKTMVWVLLKELEYKVEKFEYKNVGGHTAEDQNQIRPSSW